jgi:stage II sporulation protein D
MAGFRWFLGAGLMGLGRSAGRPWWLAAVIWLGAIAPANAALELRVGIEDGVSQVTVGSSTKAVVRDAAGQPIGEIAPMNAFVAQPQQGQVALDRWKSSLIWVEPTGGGLVFIGDRWYRGKTLVIPTDKGLTAVNYVDLEHYLYSVIGGEMGNRFPQEALKAQAVAARSYALYQRQKSRSTYYDVGDTPAWQVYDGVSDESAATLTAVNATAGQVLTYNNEIIEAVFHSSAGGCTENVEDVWTEALPYLRAATSPDEGTPNYEWTASFSAQELSQRITGVGNIEKIEVEKATTCGRAKAIKVTGDKGVRSLDGDDFRLALDLKSTLIKGLQAIESPTNAGKNNTPESAATIQIVGRGFGHGLGLSQWGAYNLALKGINYQAILNQYYFKTTLSKIKVE